MTIDVPTVIAGFAVLGLLTIAFFSCCVLLYRGICKLIQAWELTYMIIRLKWADHWLKKGSRPNHAHLLRVALRFMGRIEKRNIMEEIETSMGEDGLGTRNMMLYREVQRLRTALEHIKSGSGLEAAHAVEILKRDLEDQYKDAGKTMNTAEIV